MKSYKVVLFVFSTIFLLGVLCAVFPEGGLKVGAVELRFPTLREALGGRQAEEDEQLVETPEEILARRLSELRAAEESEYVEFVRTSPIRFFFPGDSLEIFDPFFDALDSALLRPTRVVHYGDSQLEEDRISNNLREQLQRRFGGCGVGLVPLVMPYPTLTMRQTRSSEPPRSRLFGAKDYSVKDGHFGPMGQAARLNGELSLNFNPAKRLAEDDPARRVERITVLTDTTKAPLRIPGAIMDTLHRPIRRYVVDSVCSWSLRLSGSADVFGVMLDGKTGVSVDNVAMRGYSGTTFNRIDAGELADFYQGENVSLIILQFGGNAVPYMHKGKALDEYAAKIRTQVQYIRSLAPKAAILFIGPSDMSTNIGGAMQTYKDLPAIIDALREAALSAGAAYWDLYTVMGGKNSMTEWVKNGYAGKDYIHFTHKGADEVGNLLAKSIFLYYDYYKWRTKPLEQQLAPEVVEKLLRDTAIVAEEDTAKVLETVDSL